MTGRDEFLQRMPKVELHVHLEGSMQPSTLLALARRHGVALPADDEAGLREWFRFRDFDHFVEIYLTCSRCLRDPEDFEALVAGFAEEQARQNVLYSEAHFTPGTHIANGVDGDEIAAALWRAIEAAEKRHGVRVRLIPDIVRDVGPARADVTLEWALAARDRGVVALGLSGSERHSNEPFRDHFRVAGEAGLHRVAHAGEHGGPDSIRSVLEVCGAERIGHGIAAARDAALARELAAAGTPLEVCPSSNVCLGAAASLAEHPFERLRAAGVEVTVNSDDPALFDTTLTAEYARLADTFGYDERRLTELSLAGVRHALLDPDERAELESTFRQQFRALGVADVPTDAVAPGAKEETRPWLTR